MTAFERRHVAVVAAVSVGDIAIGDEPVVGRVEVYPTRIGHEHRRPGVGHVGADEAGLSRRGRCLEVAAHVAGGEPERTQAADRQVGEVLADPLAALEQLGQRGAHRGRARLVGEVGVDARVELGQSLSRAAARSGTTGRGVGGDGRRYYDLGRVEQEVAGVKGVRGRVEAKTVAHRFPGLVDGQGDRGGPRDLDDAFGGDREPGVRLEHGEIGDAVPVEVRPLAGSRAARARSPPRTDRHTWPGTSRGSRYSSP